MFTLKKIINPVDENNSNTDNENYDDIETVDGTIDGVMETYDDDGDENENENENENEYLGYDKSFNEIINKLYSLDNINDNTVNYKGLELLNTDYKQLNDLLEKKKIIHVCAYNINTSGKYPFLQYFLRSVENTETGEKILEFPNFTCNNINELLIMSINILFVIGLSYNFKEDDSSFKGYYQKDETNIMVFYDLSNLKIEPIILNKYDDLFLVLMDEIINQEKMGNIPIHHLIVDLFKNDTELAILTDNMNTAYEIPTVVYHGCPKQKMEFILTFGVSPSQEINHEDSLLGPYFYFTDYDNAKKMGDGLVRIAIFLDTLCVKMNYTNDRIDESQLIQYLLETNDNSTEIYNNIKMTERLSDRYGVWTINSNSVYIGPVKLDDGSIFKKGPIWVVKDYEQQTPLSTF